MSQITLDYYQRPTLFKPENFYLSMLSEDNKLRALITAKIESNYEIAPNEVIKVTLFSLAAGQQAEIYMSEPNLCISNAIDYLASKFSDRTLVQLMLRCKDIQVRGWSNTGSWVYDVSYP